MFVYVYLSLIDFYHAMYVCLCDWLATDIVCMTFTNWSNCYCIARKRGIVVNLSSSSALNPAPLLCVYAASKVRTCR